VASGGYQIEIDNGLFVVALVATVALVVAAIPQKLCGNRIYI
tara:strand:- start:518 stop:643 length:126 start_codon:yes stop_codon:yes gene_type:complete